MEWLKQLPIECEKKLLNDVFYRSMVEHGLSYSDLLESGWINTLYSDQENKENYKVYSSNIPNHIFTSNKDEFCILLNTGSYAPSHFGHIEMMLQAKIAVEAIGHEIDMIVLSPSHDSYVLNKSEDIKDWCIHRRIKSLQQTINEFPFDNKNDQSLFSIDTWESLFCNCPINFTDVIFKIEQNINNYFNKRVKVFYVFGSDNQLFINSFKFIPEYFKSKYFAVCVQRDGYPIEVKEKSENIIYTTNKNYFYEQSREIRKKTNANNYSQLTHKETDIYGVRLDSSFALKNWINIYPQYEKQLNDTYFIFSENLKFGLFQATEVQTESILEIEQKKYVLSLIKQNPNILNLDSCTNYFGGQFNLELSRLFSLSSQQEHPISIVSRGEENKNLLPGDYWLVDDDIASGNTVRLVKEKLTSQGINITKEISLLELFIQNNYHSKTIYDIVDTRDFLLGTNGGGLVCQTIDGNIRFPYFSPWINLNTRAKIPYQKIKEFNLFILNANIEFFKTNSFITLNDIPSGLKSFLIKNYQAKDILGLIKQHFSYLEKNIYSIF
jgi:nicotinic acid mononucleotide adenylyltransferase